jgi:hypothetical protein
MANSKTTTLEDLFDGALKKAWRQCCDDYVEKEIEKAKENLERVLREKAATYAIQASKHCDIEHLRDRIVITFYDKTKNP